MLKLSTDVKEFLRKVTPAAMGSSVVQINLWIDLMIASYFTGAVSYLYYADRVAQLPLSIVGTAMGTALLPMLSRKLGAGELVEANRIQENALEVVLLLTIPASYALICLNFDIMHVLFVRGEFTDFDAAMAAYAMAAFAFGLPAFALIKILSSCFFALKDTKTPVISATYAMIINIFLNLVFVLLLRHFQLPVHVGIAMATALAAWFNAAFLARKLFGEKHFSLSGEFRKRLIKIIISTVIMSFALLFMTTHMPSGTIDLAIEIIIGGGIYLGLILLLKTFPLNELKSYLLRNRV
jgi:putative peptidoglycan lipid II flippase